MSFAAFYSASALSKVSSRSPEDRTSALLFYGSNATLSMAQHINRSYYCMWFWD